VPAQVGGGGEACPHADAICGDLPDVGTGTGTGAVTGTGTGTDVGTGTGTIVAAEWGLGEVRDQEEQT
jgi:hypothetical protein